MSNHLKQMCIPIIVSFALLSACNNEDKKGDDTASTSSSGTTDTSPTTAKAAGKAANYTGTLDILVADRKVFTDLGQGTKIVFSNSFGADNKVHLTGWVLQGNSFPGSPIALGNDSPSNETYDANTYFGNVVLQPGDFNKIRKELVDDPNLKFVFFVPHKVDNYFIGYSLYPSPTAAFAPKAGVAATADANPSPPKTY